MISIHRYWKARLRRRQAGDRGVVIIVIALLMTALLIITALVVDHGMVRQNRQADKSATDFAAAAGIRGLDDGSGYVKVWKGICAARQYLVANNKELASLLHVDGSGNPISDPCASPPGTICGAPATWGTYMGVADGGRIKVTIKNGYQLSTSGFSEDSGAYAGDVGDGPCDNLAVIIEEREKAYFGGVAGASGYDTVIRSVARLVQGEEGDQVAALVLLETKDCKALENSGTDETIVRVEGNGTSPGVIHSDSLGYDRDCSSGTIYHVNGSTPAPRIVVARSSTADPETGLYAPGLISSVSLSGAPSAMAGNTSQGTHATCAQVEASDCAGAGGGSGPVARGPIGRRRVDTRYRQPIIDLRQEATQRFQWDSSAATAAGFTSVSCGDPRTEFTDAKIFIDCGTGSFDAAGKTFADSVDEVVIIGDLSLGGVARFRDVDTLYVKGTGGNTVSLTNGNEFLVNDGGEADCDDRYADDPTARTKLVIGSGRIKASGGVLRMCQTMLFMMDGAAPLGACPIPTSDGTGPPAGNTCKGNIGVSGGTIDWSAPNVKNDPANLPDSTDFANFEDLALWSETSGAGGSAWDVVGDGGLSLSGIFFTPNADPFKLAGGGSIDIYEAQFITRKLRVTGGATLAMQPDAHNSILIPVLGGFTLVR